MIIAENLVKNYAALQVLKGINLEIKTGELVSITGPSGAGKTTLLQILGTLDKADTGKVLINNQAIEKLNEKQLAAFRNQHLGFVFQFHHLLPEFTAEENVALPALLAGKRRTEALNAALDLLQILGIKERAKHKPSALSGGEQQRVAVARALVNKPAVLFADEPSGNLDSKHAEDLHNLFFDLQKSMGQTTVIVTHNEALAERSDRRIKLIDGRVI